MIEAILTGDAIADPVARQAGSGAKFATVAVRTGVGSESILIGVSAFGSLADDLLALRKGDSGAFGGRLELNVWTDREGRERRDWRLTLASLMTVYGFEKRRKAGQERTGADAFAGSK